MGKRGPKPLPDDERSVKMSFTFPPELWKDVEEYTQPGERSRLVQECLRRTVQRRKRERATEKAE